MDDQHLILEPSHLRMLRRLVTVLTVVMIFGFIIIVTLFVMRLGTQESDAVTLPSEITLPVGVSATSYTYGQDWFAVTGSDNIIRIYNLDNSLLQEIRIQPE